MANDDNNGSNGTANIFGSWVARWVIGGGSIASLIFAFGVNVAQDARIAIEVAQQHGEEILIIRRQIEKLENEIHNRTQLRYTSSDAKRDFRYIEREIEALKKELAAHEEAKTPKAH